MDKQLKGLKKILFVKLSSIGDVIHTLPALNLLKEEYPNLEISWLVEAPAYNILKDHPYLDEVILFPKVRFKKKFRANKLSALGELKDFIKDLRARDFDLTFDFQGLFKSGFLAFLSGSQSRVGFADGREGSKLFYHEKIKSADKIHVVDKYLSLVKETLSLIETDKVDFSFQITKDNQKKVKRLLSKAGIDNNYIVINPFTSWNSKNWYKRRYTRLADKIKEQLGYQIVFTGSKADKDRVDEIIDSMKDSAVNLAGKTTLKDLAQLYRQASLFIGGDTGPMHLAAAVETKVIALMGATPPFRNGPYGSQHTVIQKDLSCINCWDRECKLESNKRRCMSEISVAEVFAKVREVD